MNILTNRSNIVILIILFFQPPTLVEITMEDAPICVFLVMVVLLTAIAHTLQNLNLTTRPVKVRNDSEEEGHLDLVLG